MMKSLQSLRNQEQGSTLLEVALITPVLALLMVGAVDFGRGYYVAMEVSSAAEAGALYGVQNTTDTSGMAAAATLDAKDVPGLGVNASYGCECSDGSNAVANCTSTPSCPANVVKYVEVDTTATYSPILEYPGVPSSFALTGKGRMRAGQ
jgi:Flp pilus assembly protein TadG